MSKVTDKLAVGAGVAGGAAVAAGTTAALTAATASAGTLAAMHPSSPSAYAKATADRRLPPSPRLRWTSRRTKGAVRRPPARTQVPRPPHPRLPRFDCENGRGFVSVIECMG